MAVIGGSVVGEAVAGVAERLGRALAEGGAVVVCGGLGGVMEAVCRGARAAGGTTVGILPGSDRAEANPHVAVAVATGLGEARNAIVVATADAVVAVAGEFGTLSEIALALRAGTPVVGLGTWELRRTGRARDGIHRPDTPEEAAALALELARGRRTPGRRPVP